MVTIDEHGRPEPPMQGDEVETLLGFLDWQRATFAWKCRDLDAAGLSMRLVPSTLTLAGLMKHLALVEEHWFSVRLWGNDLGPPFGDVDFDVDPDWEFRTAPDDAPNHLWGLWDAAVERSRANVNRALADDTLGQLARRPHPDREVMSLRWILLHMIEEYARHNGHADLLRENVDGSTGE